MNLGGEPTYTPLSMVSVEVPPLPLLPRSNTESSSSDGGSKLRMRARLKRASAAVLSLEEDDLSLRLLSDGGEATDEDDRSAGLSSASLRSLASLLLSSSELDDTEVDELGDVAKELADDNDDTSDDRVPSWLRLAVAALALVAVVLRSKFKDDLVANSRRRYRRRMISLPSSLDSSSELLSENGTRNDQKTYE